MFTRQEIDEHNRIEDAKREHSTEQVGQAPKHTPGPWEIMLHDDHAGFGLWAESWGFLGFLDSGTPDEANARRIVACVNACEGITTDEIEHGDIALIRPGSQGSIKAERDRLASLNRELVEALEALVREVELVGLLDSPQLGDARAALAKHREIA